MKQSKTRRRWFRFRLRSLLIMFTLLSVPLGWAGWEMDQRRREKAVVAWVEEMGGEVYFNSASKDERSWWEKTKDNWFGERVRFVNFSNTQLRDVSPLAELKSLKILYLGGFSFSDLSPLVEFKNLESLILFSTKVSDLSPLEELKKLEVLYLVDTPVSDLSPLAELKKLEELLLQGTHVSEEQVEELRLALPNCDISF